MKTFANFDSVMRNLNLAQTPKETAVGGTRHEGDAQGNISPLTASTPTSGNPYDEPPDTNSDPITHQKEEDRLPGVPQTLMMEVVVCLIHGRELEGSGGPSHVLDQSRCSTMV